MRVRELPEHLVEVHAFHDSTAAEAFVSGLELAASGNTLAWTWEPGEDEKGSRTVIVARLSEDRPAASSVEEAVKVVVHGRNDYEGRAHRASLQRIRERDEAHRRKAAENTSELRDGAREAGFEIDGWGFDWVRVSGVTVVKSDGEYSASIDDGYHGARADIRERFSEVLSAEVRHDVSDHSFVMGPVANAIEALAMVRTLIAAVGTCENFAREIQHQEWVESVKMTPSRRRFLEAAVEHGIRISYQRANLQATAGGITIKSTEFQVLSKIGWIAKVDGAVGVTDAGLTAAGLEPSSSLRGP